MRGQSWSVAFLIVTRLNVPGRFLLGRGDLLGHLGTGCVGVTGDDLGAAAAGGPAGEVGRNGGRVGPRVGGQQYRRPRGLAEVEVLDQVAEDRRDLPDIGP